MKRFILTFLLGINVFSFAFAQNCTLPMQKEVFVVVEASMMEAKNDDIRATIFAQTLQNNCLSSVQVKNLLKYFVSENNRFQAAKASINKLVDPQNFYFVYSLFSVSDHVNNLMNMIPGMGNGGGGNDKDHHHHHWQQEQCTSNEAFKNMMASINQQAFSGDKVKIAKQIIQTNKLKSEHIAKIVSSLSFSTDKLDVAKFGYKYVFDPGNYYLVNSAFTFSYYKSELSKYIQAHPREDKKGKDWNNGKNWSNNNNQSQFPSDEQFQKMLTSVKKSAISSDRLKTAKQIVASNKLKSSQIKQFMLALSFDSDRFNLAKFAYAHVYDKNNYYLVNDAFQTSTYANQLNDFILDN